METIYHESSLKSGVYKIYNKLNDRIYIGSAKEFKERFKGHFSSLKNNKHSNKFLQNDFNKCGAEAFVFEVLEVIEGPKLDRTTREKEILKEYWDGCKECYNIQKETVSIDRSCFSKTPEETSKILSSSLKKYYSNIDNRKKHSLLLVGKKKPKRSLDHSNKIANTKIGKKASIETKEKMSFSQKSKENYVIHKENYLKYEEKIRNAQIAAVALKHKLITPDGNLLEIINLNKFCIENGLHSSGFRNLLKKNEKSTYKGWKYLGCEKIYL